MCHQMRKTLEEDPSSGNAQRVRRLSEKQVTEDPQKDASYLLASADSLWRRHWHCSRHFYSTKELGITL